MKIVILTSSLQGSASVILPRIIANSNIEVSMVIYNKGLISNKKKHLIRKAKKVMKIGFWGAINGIRLRKWYRINDSEPIDDIKSFCHNKKITFRTTDSINSLVTKELFKESKADLGISLGNSYIAKSIFSIPQFGMLNIHHELLPEYTNAQSIIWQLHNQSRVSGYTIHKINSKIDQGDIIYRDEMPIIFKESLSKTVNYNYNRLIQSSAEGLNIVLEDFNYYFNQAINQTDGNSYTTPSLFQFIRIIRNHNLLKRDNL